jgi:hypothetical protein
MVFLYSCILVFLYYGYDGIMGIMVLWYYGIPSFMVYYGNMILWYNGIMVLLHYGYYGIMVLWYYGIMVVWVVWVVW